MPSGLPPELINYKVFGSAAPQSSQITRFLAQQHPRAHKLRGFWLSSFHSASIIRFRPGALEVAPNEYTNKNRNLQDPYRQICNKCPMGNMQKVSQFTGTPIEHMQKVLQFKGNPIEHMQKVLQFTGNPKNIYKKCCKLQGPLCLLACYKTLI